MCNFLEEERKMDKTIKEVAEELGVSINAIHKHKQRIKELQEHMRKSGRVWLIDDVGQEILREHTKPQITDTIVPMKLYEEISQLQNDKIDLLVRINKLENMLAEERQKLTEMNAQTLLLAAAENQIDELKNEIDNLKTENNKYKPTIFGLYRKTN